MRKKLKDYQEKIKLNKLHKNNQFLFPQKTEHVKRSTCKNIACILEKFELLDHTELEHKINNVCTLFVYVDLELFSSKIEMKNISNVPAYLYVIKKSLCQLEQLNFSISAVSSEYSFASEYNDIKIQKILTHLSVKKITYLQNIEFNINQVWAIICPVLEQMHEKYDY